MALFGIIGLMIFIYMRPHEFLEALKSYNFLYIFLAITVVGIFIDISSRKSVWMKTPMHRWVLYFWGWNFFTILIRRPTEVVGRITYITVSLILYFVISQAVQSIRSFLKVVTIIFALGVFVAYIGADQGFSPFQCVIVDPTDRNGVGTVDGRLCNMVNPDGTSHDGYLDCMEGGNPGTVYICEKGGLLGTTSVGGGRVRYLGVLLDPNELALASAVAVPFAFAFLEMRVTLFRILLLMGTLAVVAIEIVFTQSRGGQIIFGSVLGSYFIKKYGYKRGLMAGGAMVVPMLMLGGRKDEAADHSTLERLNCAAEGIKMLMHYPLTGVGHSLFTDHHFLTAHNAYILAPGELGLPGTWLFGVLIYLGVKVPVKVLQFPMEDTKESNTMKALGMAMLAAMIGCSIGIYFLSWTYHYVLWIHFGLVGSLANCVRRIYPTFDVTFDKKEMRNILYAYVGYLVVWSGYIKYKGAWDM